MEHNRGYNRGYIDFKRYQHEIFLECMEQLEKSNLTVVTDTILRIGLNELHHMFKYYQKIILNALFFKEKKILFDYNQWLYRVYYNRGIDLEFFLYLNQLFNKVSKLFIDHKVYIPIEELFHYSFDQHLTFKENASKRTIFIDNDKEASLLLEYLTGNNKDAIMENFCNKIETLDQFIEFYDEIVFNAMKKVGLLWERGDVSIAKEHIATNLLDEVLIEVLNKIPPKEQEEKHVFLSSAPEELHGLGVKVASIVFEKLGYRVTSLGVNIPPNEIEKAIREFQPDYVLFSATLQSSIIDIALLIDQIEQSREHFIKNFKIGIAGNGFEKMIHPAKTLKASFYIKYLKDFKNFSL